MLSTRRGEFDSTGKSYFRVLVQSLHENDDLLAAKSPQKVAKTANK
jgi:hypothetical protein